MTAIQLPPHVVSQRRDGRREVLLHRSMAVVSDDKIEIKSARGLVVLPLLGLLVSFVLGTWVVMQDGGAPFWSLVLVLFLLLFLVPISVMSLVGSVVGADIVVDKTKGSATWQQGYLGMGIGTKELVPFHKIAYLVITVEGDEEDRWQDESDDLRQFALTLVKASGKHLKIAQVPVPAYGAADGMDRTMAVANAIATLSGAEVRLPEGWEIVEIDTETGEVVDPARSKATEDENPPKAAKRGKARGRRA